MPNVKHLIGPACLFIDLVKVYGSLSRWLLRARQSRSIPAHRASRGALAEADA